MIWREEIDYAAYVIVYLSIVSERDAAQRGRESRW